MRLAPLTDFANIEGIVHLAAGGESPPLHAQFDAVRSYLEVKGRSSAGWPAASRKQETYDRCKATAAALLGVSPTEVAFCSSAAEGASQVALSLPWRGGDNVVVEDVEFLSASLPWTRLRERGVEVRVITHADWTADEAHFRAAVDARTRMIATSQVDYLSGIQHNLEALRQIADRVGAYLFADVSHAFGAVPVPARLCDFAVAATYKWPLGCQGIALLMWNRERVPEIEPAIVGWRSVRDDLGAASDLGAPRWKDSAERLEAGNPAWLPIFYLDAGLAYLDALGMGRIDAHNRALSAQMHAGLVALELPLMTPTDPRFRAGNNCFRWEHPEAVRDQLSERGILVSGYSGRVRISTHIWNDADDVDACLGALRALV